MKGREFRCSKCRRLLAVEGIFQGWVRIKCPRCSETNFIRVTRMTELQEKGIIIFKGGEK
jgi:LSD1 subclass zinc finger protein